MDANEKKHKINEIVKWLNEKNPRYLAVTVAIDTEAPEILISHKDGGEIRIMRDKLAELDEMLTTIDHNYMVVAENLNGIPVLCFSLSI